MLNLEMDIYFGMNGVQATVVWASEEDYQLVKKTLVDKGALWFDSDDGRASKPDFVYVESEQQRDALGELMRALQKKRTPQNRIRLRS